MLANRVDRLGLISGATHIETQQENGKKGFAISEKQQQQHERIFSRRNVVIFAKVGEMKASGLMTKDNGGKRVRKDGKSV